ncbi:ParB/Srx family N-terminal domain-containing protein [Streptomyces sp. NBC_01723]|uniref:ParB/Srx family N-terminal domain-containing protein n=1 Tax=Streptomyces sp. NBC_01723 TaxID=2975921 RepID=UPI002E37A0B0|nr:ParB/Srx family N-terminal domain-containing protein [Streptomyces sp. NBC_01723]
MLGIIAVADVLDMLTPDDDDTPDCLYVRDVLPHKRTSEHYADLLDEIRADGIALPIMIRTLNGRPWLVDGHHRVAAALDAGLTHLVWSDLPLEIEDHQFNYAMRDDWRPYRPAT